MAKPRRSAVERWQAVRPDVRRHILFSLLDRAEDPFLDSEEADLADLRRAWYAVAAVLREAARRVPRG